MKPDTLNEALKAARERKKLLEAPSLPEAILKKAEAYDEIFWAADTLITKKQQLDAREKALDEYERQLKKAFKELENRTDGK